MHLPRGKGEWALFNLEEDQGEMMDLASEDREKLVEPIRCWEEYYMETGLFNYGWV